MLAVLGVCAGAFVLAGASDQKADGTTYRIVFDNAFGLTKGGDFRVGGVNAGQTTGFDVEKKQGESPKAVVIAEITKPGFGDFRENATCDIRPQSLIGEYYVDCQPGTSEKPLPDNTVQVEQTTSTIPTDLVNNIMRRPYRERFRLIIAELGTGLAGRPDDLQEVLRRAHPGLRETSKVLRILGDQNQVIKNFIADSDTVVLELERNKRDVVRWVREAGDAAEISATRRNELRAGFQRFPEFLDELRPTMARLGELADEQTPLMADLQRAAPDLDTFFTRLGPFAEASRPAVRSLGEAGEVGVRAFREGRQEVAELRKLAAGSPALAKPLRQFLQTIDDRKRAIENDPRAKASAPPAPDPTAIPGEGGFTGHGGHLELLLLADAQHQHAGRHGAHPARVAHGRAALHRVAQRAAEDARGPRDVRELQLVPRPEPARHLQPRPARRRLEPGGCQPPRAERTARLPARRAARRGPARGRPAPRPARHLEAADRAAA